MRRLSCVPIWDVISVTTAVLQLVRQSSVPALGFSPDRAPCEEQSPAESRRMTAGQFEELFSRTFVASFGCRATFSFLGPYPIWRMQVVGSGPPLVCIPGGPGQAVEYFDELGGLSEHHTLILLDNRGTGASQAPHDPTTFRIEQLVDDVEALRFHLGLDQMDLFGHSASGGTCLLYAARYPQRLDRLVLVDPSLRVVGIQSNLGVDEVLAQRTHEPWYADAVALFTRRPHRRRNSRSSSGCRRPCCMGGGTRRLASRRRRNPSSSPKPLRDGFYAGFEVDT